ncbi:ammonium transporter channel family [Thraustotheca clavata]|uniref:Ammonium transporter n=1 Tax=Thraustotheca clavata TaxID=74557 RepID=A0A1W0A0K4_9STRA|nr:ammonium transporter channel family [Thraustotheca clavata]
MNITSNSQVTLTIDGQHLTTTWVALTKELTTNQCSESGCTSDVASASALDVFWLLFGGCMVFIMILGFALLEIGCCHVKNTKHILMRNLGDLCISGLTFYVVGYAFIFGGGNAFIGNSGFFLQGDIFDTSNAKSYAGLPYANWFFQWAITSVCVTIFSGAVAERISLGAYFCYTFLVGAFIYPIAAHWIWSTTGWASVTNTSKPLFGVGAIDFAGCGCIHMIGGASALVGCIIIGPRKGRFSSDGKACEMPKQSTLFQTMGTLILWFGWYGFNCVSTFSLRGNLSSVMAKVAVNLTLAACMGGVCTVALDRLFGSKTFDICMGNNGILAGCVSITGSCSVIEPEGAVALGAIASLVYFLLAHLIVKSKIDDVVDAIPVHLGCGTLGALAPGFFASSKGVAMAIGTDSCGVFYTCNGHQGSQLAAQFVYVLAIFAWIVGFCTILFTCLNKFNVLRCTAQAEEIGMDKFEHGGPAYEFESILTHRPTVNFDDVDVKIEGDSPHTT